jgi:hypothetical protein
MIIYSINMTIPSRETTSEMIEQPWKTDILGISSRLADLLNGSGSSQHWTDEWKEEYAFLRGLLVEVIVQNVQKGVPFTMLEEEIRTRMPEKNVHLLDKGSEAQRDFFPYEEVRADFMGKLFNEVSRRLANELQKRQTETAVAKETTETSGAVSSVLEKRD